MSEQLFEEIEKLPEDDDVVKNKKKEIEQSDIQFVIKNVRSKSYQDMAEELNLTKYQINRILMDIKKTLRENAKGDELKEKKVEEYISENLTREKSSIKRGGGAKKQSEIRTSIDEIVGDIMKDLK